MEIVIVHSWVMEKVETEWKKNVDEVWDACMGIE